MTISKMRFPARAAAWLTPALCLASPLPAGGQAALDSLPRYRLEGVTVTVMRVPTLRSELPQRVDIVTPTDLRIGSPTTVAAALRRNTPIDIIEFPGLLAGVSIRGFRPQYTGINPRTLLLVDGRPAGTTNLALFDAALVERVEVLRGPASALYGSSAMGGVVNLITRTSDGPLAGEIRAGYGSFGSYQAQLRAGGRVATRVDLDLSLSTFGQGDGYRTGSRRTLSSESVMKTFGDGRREKLAWVGADTVLGFTEHATRSGSVRLGVGLGGSWRMQARAEGLGGDGVQNPGDLGSPWDSRSLKDVQRHSLELGIAGSSERHTPTIRVYTAVESVDYYSAPAAPHFVSFRTPTRTYGLQAQDEARVGALSLTFGGDLAAARARSEAFAGAGIPQAPYSPDSEARSIAPFAQARLALLDRRMIVSAGARLDRVTLSVEDTPLLEGFIANTERHTVFTPNGGVRYTVAGGLQLFGNLGRAFVTPDAFHVAGYSEIRAGAGRASVFVTQGNPELRPETSRTGEAGLALSRPGAGLEVELAYFDTAVRDRITASPLPTSGFEVTARGDTVLARTGHVNVDEARIRGIEARADYDLGAIFGFRRSVRLFLNGTRILEAEDRFIMQDRVNRIRNVAATTAIAGLHYDDARLLDVRLSGRHVGERVDADYVDWANPGEILYPAYLVVDLAGGLRLQGRYRLALEATNLLDEDYFEVRGYPLPGRSLRASLSAAF